MRPALKPYVHVFKKTPNTYVFYDWGKQRLWEIKGDDRIEKFVTIIDGKRNIEEIASFDGFNEQLVNLLIEKLTELGVVYDTDSIVDMESKLIQSFIPYTTSRYTASDYVNILHASSVLLIGVGGVGSWVAQMLSMQEIKHIILVDPDTVEYSNLHRQAIFTKNDVGEYKVECLSREISRLNNFTSVTPKKLRINNLSDLEEFNDVDLIISCADEPSSTEVSLMISEFGFKNNIPHIVGAGYTTAIGTLPQTIIPSDPMSACLKCHNPKPSSKLGDFITNGKGGAPLGPLSAILGEFIAFEALRVLTGFEKPLFLNSRGEFNSLTFSFEKYSVSIEKDCAFCSKFRK